MKVLVTYYDPRISTESRFTAKTSSLGVACLSASLLNTVEVTSFSILLDLEASSQCWLALWTRDVLIGPRSITSEGVTFHPSASLIMSALQDVSAGGVSLLHRLLNEEDRADESPLRHLVSRLSKGD
jgi:hypothetical protein